MAESGIALKEESRELAPQEGGRDEITPVYAWKTNQAFFLSWKQKKVADVWLKTRNLQSCVKALEKAGIKRTRLSIQKWLEKPHIRQYVAEKFEEQGMAAGWSKEKWLAMMTEHFQGLRRLKGSDLYAMKLIASIKGWNEAEAQASIVNQINFVQANGKS